MFQMEYEPLYGSVVSIDTTLNGGFVADDLNFQGDRHSRDETPF